jgi:3-oxocholest-4-en-26-oate---CoA ligase
MTVCGERRTTYGEMAERTRRLANFLADKGFGVHDERDGLRNWECGQDRVALVMYNDRYPEMVLGCLKARTIPVNVNHHYTPREIADLLDYVKPRAVIYHRALGAKFADVLPPDRADLLIEVGDGSDAPRLAGAVALEDAVAQGDPNRRIAGSPDDLIMYCTGGTTGRPKGVLWRQGDTYVSSMLGRTTSPRPRSTTGCAGTSARRGSQSRLSRTPPDCGPSSPERWPGCRWCSTTTGPRSTRPQSGGPQSARRSAS